MSDLTQFRDHARFMAGQEHAPGCPPVRSKPPRVHDYRGGKWCGEAGAHGAHEWYGTSRFGDDLSPSWKCAGICGGCVSPADRDLWKRLADEIDDHLSRGEHEDLFGELSAEPTDDGSKG